VLGVGDDITSMILDHRLGQLPHLNLLLSLRIFVLYLPPTKQEEKKEIEQKENQRLREE
jgi:hypothetical protein